MDNVQSPRALARGSYLRDGRIDLRSARPEADAQVRQHRARKSCVSFDPGDVRPIAYEHVLRLHVPGMQRVDPPPR